MVRHARKTDRTEVDRVEVPELFDTVLGHHASFFMVGFTGPVKFSPLEMDAVLSPCGFQHPDAFGNDLLADTVSGDNRNS